MVYSFLRDYNEYENKWAGKTDLAKTMTLLHCLLSNTLVIFYHKMQNILCIQCLFQTKIVVAEALLQGNPITNCCRLHLSLVAVQSLNFSQEAPSEKPEQKTFQHQNWTNYFGNARASSFQIWRIIKEPGRLRICQPRLIILDQEKQDQAVQFGRTTELCFAIAEGMCANESKALVKTERADWFRLKI